MRHVIYIVRASRFARHEGFHVQKSDVSETAGGGWMLVDGARGGKQRLGYFWHLRSCGYITKASSRRRFAEVFVYKGRLRIDHSKGPN